MGPTRRSWPSATLEPKTPQQDPNPDKNTLKRQTPFSTTAIISASVKSVVLHEWWLVKAKGKGLAVGGFASRERLGVRVFSSAAISKRHTTTVLEAADGIMITISGFINRSRTHQNGFPFELYNHFLLGFPFDWEEYAAVVLGEDSTDIAASIRNSASQKFSISSANNESNSLPFSLDDLPVTKARDLMMLSFGDSDYCSLAKKILSDIQRTSPDSAVGHTNASINLNTENSSPVENWESGTTETPPQHKKVKVRDDKNMITKENKRSSQKPTEGRYASTSSNVISARSVARSESTRRRSRKFASLPPSDLLTSEGVSTRSMTRRSVSTRSMTRKKISASCSPPDFH